VKKLLLISLFTLILVGCKKEEDPCASNSYYTGNPDLFRIFIFDLTDKTTGENLFTNGILSVDDIECYDENKMNVPFYIYDDTGRTFITYTFPKLGVSTYTLKVSPDIEILIFRTNYYTSIYFILGYNNTFI